MKPSRLDRAIIGDIALALLLVALLCSGAWMALDRWIDAHYGRVNWSEVGR